MPGSERGLVAVLGATGRQGGAVSRALLAQGWPVRALTRKPDGRKAAALAALGAEVVRADMDDPATLDRAFAGAYGVFSVQNPATSGHDGEVRQGRNVCDAARRAGIEHVVYGSAGTGERGTGVPSWESKLDIEDHFHELGLPVTVLRPTAFMELMTDRDFYPAMGTWHVWPKLTGGGVPIPWLACGDLGVIAEKVFADPARFIGQELRLAAEFRSLDECRTAYTGCFGRKPKSIPMPVWLFTRFTPDTVLLWRWLRTGTVEVDPGLTSSVHPDVLTVEAWLGRQSAGSTARR